MSRLSSPRKRAKPRAPRVHSGCVSHPTTQASQIRLIGGSSSGPRAPNVGPPSGRTSQGPGPASEPVSRIQSTGRLWIEVDHEALAARLGVLPALGRMRKRIEPQCHARIRLRDRWGKRRFRLDLDAILGHERDDLRIHVGERGIYRVGVDGFRRAERREHCVRQLGRAELPRCRCSYQQLGCASRSRRRRDERSIARE